MFGKSDKKSRIKLPFGLRDIFPTESVERNGIKALVKKEFSSWGYGEVKTPVIEYTENISIGVGSGWKEKLINFIDIDGSLLSMRSDMTIPIARLAGMRLKGEQLPARFCYFADVYRQTGTQAGNKRMLSQAGLEFLGSNKKMEADAEVMVIMIRVLKNLGLVDFKMSVGHMGFINGLFDWLGLDEKVRDDFKKYMVEKDFVKIGNILQGYDSDKAAVFTKLMQPEKNLDKISRVVSEMDDEGVSSAFKYLTNLYLLLKDQGLDGYIVFDLSIIRDFDYYTGLLFEVYCSSTSDMIGTGGRYDDLVKKFGKDIPATGFALDIDTVHDAMGEKYFTCSPKIMLKYLGDGDAAGIMRLADSIRKKDTDVELMLDTAEDTVMLAGERGCSYLVETSQDFSEFRITDIKSGKSKNLENSAFLEEIKKWKKN